MAVSTSRPDAPTISPTANAARTTGALGCSEESACVSSKSREWPSAPLSSAATAGVQVLLSPNPVDSPLASSFSASSIPSSEGADSPALRAPKQGGRRFRCAARGEGAAEEVERQHLGALQYLRRDIRKFQIGDIGG